VIPVDPNSFGIEIEEITDRVGGYLARKSPRLAKCQTNPRDDFSSFGSAFKNFFVFQDGKEGFQRH
jgi:hypothetical protein